MISKIFKSTTIISLKKRLSEELNFKFSMGGITCPAKLLLRIILSVPEIYCMMMKGAFTCKGWWTASTKCFFSDARRPKVEFVTFQVILVLTWSLESTDLETFFIDAGDLSVCSGFILGATSQLIGHFRVRVCLLFKESLSAKFFLWKLVFIHM